MTQVERLVDEFTALKKRLEHEKRTWEEVESSEQAAMEGKDGTPSEFLRSLQKREFARGKKDLADRLLKSYF